MPTLMNYRVVSSPEAQEQLAELYRHIAEAASPVIAARYTEAIVSYCESLRTLYIGAWVLAVDTVPC